MAGRVVSVHCIAGGGLEAKTLKLTLPAAWQESPCARLLKAVAKRCEGVDAGDLALETADGARVDAAAPIASTAAERDLFVRRAAAAAPAGPAVPCEGAPLANVFVVTLARDDARVRHTETYTRRRLPEAEVFEAVDGASPALAAFLRAKAITLAPAWAKACTVGQLGCMCSHMALWRKVVDDGLDHAVVLEDDVLVADGFRTEVANILGELPALWDHCYLFHHPQCKRDLPLPGAKHVQRAFETWGTVAYVVSRRGAEKLLARTEGASCAKAIDETMMGLVRDGELNSYCALRTLTGTAGQINPMQPTADSRLGSNVWGSPKLLPS
ncbi:procollagen galactosyltransferase [Aureococcus anophagefferens]|nr:procollagen galactosyltransferase [Aureococcus anophagefferens]